MSRRVLSLIVKLEIPICGTAIQIQQQALKLDHVPDSWPCNMESGWAAHYGRLDMTFEAMCQHLVQNQFTSDAFQGDSESYLFQWDTNVWDTWPEIEGHDFKEDWDKEGHKRSETLLTTDDIQQLHRDRLVRRAFHTSGFNSPFSAQCSIAGQSRLGNSARDLSLR